MLIGEYNHSIDGKNRISLPVKFRQKMGKKVVVTPGLDHCLFVFTPKEWEKISVKLSEASIGQSDSRSFSRFMFGGAVEERKGFSGRCSVPCRDMERQGLGSIQEGGRRQSGGSCRKTRTGRRHLIREKALPKCTNQFFYKKQYSLWL